MVRREDFTYITKFKLLSYFKCENLFFSQLSKSNSSNRQSESLYGLENSKVKEIAKSCFDPGISINYNSDILQSFQETMDAMGSLQVIHHPVFIYEDLVSSPDILQPSNSGSYIAWDIVTSINTKKETEIMMGFHRYTIEKLNLPINEYKILKINPKYIRKEEFDIQGFFHEMGYTNKVVKVQPELEILIEELRYLRHHKGSEFGKIKKRLCLNYKTCPIPKDCFPDLGNGNIFTLRDSAKIAMELYKKGIKNLIEIPENTILSEKQKIQITSDRLNLPHIEKDNIRLFLNNIQYPVYYLDFETINPQIPIYPFSKPYQHIPFLISLHILDSPDSIGPRHFDYIQTDTRDPRHPILEILSKTIGKVGTILCFNDYFEKRCIQDSIVVYPEFEEWFESVKKNFLDVAIPFKNFSYYNPKQNGSASLKEILPALTNTSHNQLAIQNGHEANLVYLKLMKNQDFESESSKAILKELKEYCFLDTYALYLIQKELQVLVDGRLS